MCGFVFGVLDHPLGQHGGLQGRHVGLFRCSLRGWRGRRQRRSFFCQCEPRGLLQSGNDRYVVAAREAVGPEAAVVAVPYGQRRVTAGGMADAQHPVAACGVGAAGLEDAGNGGGGHAAFPLK